VQAANYVLAPLILVVFVIVVSFVLLNMVRCLRVAFIIARSPQNLLPQFKSVAHAAITIARAYHSSHASSTP
jgi:hypothetical protein